MTNIIINNENNFFEICYGGSDLYFAMNNYNDDNELDNQFIIDKENILYDYLKILFKTYLQGKNKLEWYSEAYGLIENQNRLIITQDDDKYIISFWQNKNNPFNLKGTCYICFCLSGSNNQEIANYFSNMLNELTNKKTLKKH